MRCLYDLIEDKGLLDEAEDRLFDKLGNHGLSLEVDIGPEGPDEDSDQEDPEQQLREALAEKESFIGAVTGALENHGLATELERSRMQMEDFRAQLLRKSQ